MQAFNLSWQLTSDLLALLAGKECEGRDFNFQGDKLQWAWAGRGRRYSGMAYPAVRGANQLVNAAGALAALTALRSALLKRLLLLLGKVDDALNDPGQKSRIQALPLLVLEVRRAAWRAWRREHDRWTAAQAIARPGGLKRSPCGPVQPLYAACRSCWPLILCGLTARRRVR